MYPDGYCEKSHYCIARYLESYVTKGVLEEEWVNLLDLYREQRHRNQYDLNLYASEVEAKDVIGATERFLDRIKKL